MTSEPFVTSQAAVDLAVKNLSKRCCDGRLSTHCHAPVQDLRHVLHWLKLLQEMEKNRRAPSPAVARLVEACKRLREHIVEQWPQGMTCSCGECAWCWETSDVAAADEALAAVEKEMQP